jgi:hypothetical protein
VVVTTPRTLNSERSDCVHVSHTAAHLSLSRRTIGTKTTLPHSAGSLDVAVSGRGIGQMALTVPCQTGVGDARSEAVSTTGKVVAGTGERAESA